MYSKLGDLVVFVPPLIVTSTGSPPEDAKRRYGRMAWRMSVALEALDSGAISRVRFCSAVGGRVGANVSVLLPGTRPLVLAAVASARNLIAATCWFFRP